MTELRGARIRSSSGPSVSIGALKTAMPTSRPVLAAFALGLALLAAACGSSAPATGSATTTDGTAVTAGSASAPGSTAATATPAATTGPAISPAPAAASAIDCTAPATATIAQTEGPYYRTGAPESTNLVTDGMPGTRLTLTGYVVDTSCASIANARVETWQADSTGAYDNTGYTLRGWVTTDAAGRFTIATVVPGEYPGRTEHVHVKITPPGGATLTTQLYFPGSTANDGDGIYDPSLDLAITPDGDALTGTYTFVLGS
jgi:protocatechuate 3,4-dioxygenase beta subunit